MASIRMRGSWLSEAYEVVLCAAIGSGDCCGEENELESKPHEDK